MKIQIVSNFYPPFFVGGYELGCAAVAEELQNRGHTINILTTSYLCQTSTHENIIRRSLYQHYSKETLFEKCLIPFREMANRRCFIKAIERFRPDLIYFWSLRGTSVSLLDICINKQIPAVIYASDRWLESANQSDYFLRLVNGISDDLPHQLIRKTLKYIFTIAGIPMKCAALDSSLLVQCTSQYIADCVYACGLNNLRTTVVPWGVRPFFLTHVDSKSALCKPDVFRILYSGQLVSHKGVHTLLSAYNIFRKKYPAFACTLRVAGAAQDFHYINTLYEIAGNDPSIHFLGCLDQELLRDEYRLADIYILPSEWQEPFAISPLEAMASGAAVVATATGGSKEIFVDGINALIFPAGNSSYLADKIALLAFNKDLRQILQVNGRQLVSSKYTLYGMVDILEQQLKAEMLLRAIY